MTNTSEASHGYYIRLFKTRSYKLHPLETIWRGISYVTLSGLRINSVFKVPFGERSFKMRLQATRRHHGAAGIYVQRRYYESLLEYGHQLLSPGENVIDGGANQGIYTCAFATHVGEAGKVFSFEPLPYASQSLKENVRLNGLRNVTLFEGALSDHSGKTFIDATPGPVSASIVYDFGRELGEEVATFAIDELRAAGRLPDAHFIKLDVEGAEYLALRGAEELIFSQRPRICMEATNRAVYEQAAEFLARAGLKPFTFDNGGRLQAFRSYESMANVFFLT